MTELKKATRPDGKTLHIIHVDAPTPSFVVCWDFNGSTWKWGAVCESLKVAERVFDIRSGRFDFLKKVSGGPIP